MKLLFLGSALLTGAFCFAGHLTLTPQEKIEYGNKRIQLLTAQIAAQKLLKNDVSHLENQLLIEQNSQKALFALELSHHAQKAR
jgi:Tfp pilus assembly protein PilN